MVPSGNQTWFVGKSTFDKCFSQLETSIYADSIFPIFCHDFLIEASIYGRISQPATVDDDWTRSCGTSGCTKLGGVRIFVFCCSGEGPRGGILGDLKRGVHPEKTIIPYGIS